MTVLKKLRGDSAPTCTPSATFVSLATHLSMSPTTSCNEHENPHRVSGTLKRHVAIRTSRIAPIMVARQFGMALGDMVAIAEQFGDYEEAVLRRRGSAAQSCARLEG